MIWRGAIDPSIWPIVSVAFPFLLLGTKTGIFVFRWLNAQQFWQLLSRLIFIYGLIIGGRELVTHSFFGSCSRLIFNSVSIKVQKINVRKINIKYKY
jgi:hypothetical protein